MVLAKIRWGGCSEEAAQGSRRDPGLIGGQGHVGVDMEQSAEIDVGGAATPLDTVGEQGALTQRGPGEDVRVGHIDGVAGIGLKTRGK